MANQIIDLTLIIPSYKAASSLDRLLHSIFSQVTQYTFNVIVVCDGPCSQTASVTARYPVHLLYTPARKGPAHARNWGLQKAQGRYIAFVDADVVLRPNWIENGINALEGSLFSLCQGPNIPDAADMSWFMSRFRKGKIICATHGTFNYLTTAQLALPQVNTAACMLRSSFIQRHKISFDETLLRCEDTDFGLQLLNHGAHMVAVPGMESSVTDGRSPWQYLLRTFWDGFYLKKVARKFGLGVVANNSVFPAGHDWVMTCYFGLHRLSKVAGGLWKSWSDEAPTSVPLQGNALNSVLLPCELHGQSYGLSPYARMIQLSNEHVVLINLQTGERGQVSRAQLHSVKPLKLSSWKQLTIPASLVSPI